MTEEKKEPQEEIEDGKPIETKVKPPTSLDDLPEQVSLPKEQWDAMQERMERLEAAASKARLFKYDQEHKGPLGKSCSLRSLDGKIILAWSDMLEEDNFIEKDANGAYHENIQINLIFEDDTKKKMEYGLFSKKFTHVPATIKSTTIDDVGRETLVVETKSGKEYKIDSKFIN